MNALFFSIILTFTLITSSHAQFESWISPGDLSEAHAHLKGISNCTQCHATAKGVPNDKCLTCHTDIKERLQKNSGYHARQEQECHVCHTEHKGSKFDLRGLTRIPFNHDDTGWSLTGGHANVKCENCHKEKRIDSRTKKPTSKITYLGNSTKCISCHADVHKSKNRSFQDCTKCHTTVSWPKVKPKLRFNHARETDFALTGAHKEVQCQSCHKQNTWAPIPHDKCSNCHADPHKGSFGPKCESCHTTLTWSQGDLKVKTGATSAKVGSFDHQKTRFPLTGLHAKVSCQTCHGPKIGKMSNFEQCSGCHNNPHGDQFQKFWTVKKQCTDCHKTTGFNDLNFSHNRDSRYKLEDKHIVVPCEQCHTNKKYRWLQNPASCATCHTDVHKGQFNKTCESCHNTKGFELYNFDHNRDSRFSLVGKHAQAECKSCHEEGKYKGTPTFCESCHNDFHEGELGNECVRCHTPTSFRSVEFDHNRGSRFQLTGKHLQTECNQCHVNFKYKIRVQKCVDCHNDVHKGSFGIDCEKCHNTSSFKASREFHNFGEYTLGGKHDLLACDTCHNTKAALRPEPMQCVSCHTDPHMNSLGNRCYTCHKQVSWTPTTFRHQQTGFELSGAHRFVTCDKCHANRIFGGLPQECIFCHSSLFQPPPANPAHPPAPLACDTCHFTFGWRPTR